MHFCRRGPAELYTHRSMVFCLGEAVLMMLMFFVINLHSPLKLHCRHVRLLRSYSNQRMYEEIRDQHLFKFEQFEETWRTAKIRLLGHLLRTSRDDPLYQVTLAVDGLHPRETIFRRPGRPKQDWLIEAYRDAYKRMHENMQFERENAAFLIGNCFPKGHRPLLVVLEVISTLGAGFCQKF